MALFTTVFTIIILVNLSFKKKDFTGFRQKVIMRFQLYTNHIQNLNERSICSLHKPGEKIVKLILRMFI